MCQRGSTGRTCWTCSSHREVIHAHGQKGSNQKSTGVLSLIAGSPSRVQRVASHNRLARHMYSFAAFVVNVSQAERRHASPSAQRCPDLRDGPFRCGAAPPDVAGFIHPSREEAGGKSNDEERMWQAI
ncbi:hypothetical protein Sru01_39770 [Sphaerisporangium rufum]|uniref:Uncharacterized protein n=1 Tax=Sphaerisporangium rufum TaxID=1381558 RepID=A0A919R816_9ACTN|nr:hypothetical protein Sru01_39770 [Sphaerisporangium rufum]